MNMTIQAYRLRIPSGMCRAMSPVYYLSEWCYSGIRVFGESRTESKLMTAICVTDIVSAQTKIHNNI